jgi:hypothetical protein
MAQQPDHGHLLVVVEALADSGNRAVRGGFTPNQGGWDCEMARPIDFSVVRKVLASDAHDVRMDEEQGRLDCLHCWSGIYGPTR